MFGKIGAIGVGSDSSAYEMSAMQNISGSHGVAGAANASGLSNASSIDKIKDCVDVEGPEQSDGRGGVNLQALKSSFSAGQGFEQGVQPSFCIGSLNGIQDGLASGIQPAGVFKPPYEG